MVVCSSVRRRDAAESSCSSRSVDRVQDKTALWGAYAYTPDEDVARVPMKIETLPFSAEQLTWAFQDMTTDDGRIAISWARTMASVTFKAQTP